MFNKKRKFFKSKIKQVERSIWDLEFKLYKIREMREERRKQRDRAMETIDAYEVQLKKPDHKEETIKELTGKKDEQIKYKEHLEQQIQFLDWEINGGAPEGAVDGNGSPIIGTIPQIEGMRELLKMYRDYLKQF